MNQQAPILVDVLAGLLRQRGSELLGDRRRTLGLLRDKVPNEGRAIRILMTAFDQGVPVRLSRGPVSELDIGREVALLSSETGIGHDLAREAVDVWAAALASGEARPAPAPARPVERLPPAPIRPEPPPAVVPLPVAALPVPAPPAPAPSGTAPHDAVGHAPGPPQSPRAQPVTVRQILKAPPRPAGPPGPVQPPAGPPAVEPLHVQPLPVQPSSVQPLPTQPPSVQPLPVRPLPVQPLPASTFGQHAPNRHEATPAAAPAKSGRLQKWAGIIVGTLAVVSGGAKLFGTFSSSGRGAPQPVSAAPAASPGGTTTAEGIAVIAPGQAWPTYRFQRLKDDPATLAFIFGLAYKGQSYTYYSAVALDTGKTTGASKLVLVHGDEEITSGNFLITMSTSLSTKYFIESVGKINNNYGAPSLCVFLNFEPKTDRLNPISSGAVGIYGVDARGGCDLNTSFGYANLKP